MGLGSAGALSDYYRATTERGTSEQANRFFAEQVALSRGHDALTAQLMASDAGASASAEGAAPKRGRLGLSTSHTRPFPLPAKLTHRHLIPLSCHLAYAKNGNVASVVLNFDAFRALSEPIPQGDRVRGIVSTFSPQARGRLLTLLNSVDREKVPAGSVWFGTLTYPSSWPRDPSEWKRHLSTFIKRFERKWGKVPIVHKLEYQRRGAPHYHLLFIWIGAKPELSAFREWMAEAWSTVVASEEKEKHKLAGTQCDPAESWGGVNSYIGKYMSKEVSQLPVDPSTGEIHPPGRYWGVHRKSLLPIQIVKEELTEKQAYRVRRILHKLARRKVPGKLRRANAFILAATSERLLNWVRQEEWELPALDPGGCCRGTRFGSIEEAEQFEPQQRKRNGRSSYGGSADAEGAGVVPGVFASGASRPEDAERKVARNGAADVALPGLCGCGDAWRWSGGV